MRTAVLISGGVDSAVVVHKLKEEGHDLTLFYIRIGMDNGEGDCSAEEDIEMCTAIAHRYGLPLEVVSLHQEYWDNVREYALRTVRSGLTPNPDMMCNKMIKFGYFEQRWGKDFDITATGHYATTTFVDGRKYLATAVDPVKDSMAMSGWPVSASPRSLRSQMMLTTPGGRSSPQISPKSSAVSGVVGAGLATMQFPATSPGPILVINRISG